MLDDSTVLKLIRDFLLADKPDDVTTHDVLMVSTLIAMKAIDHEVQFSQGTLGNIMRCTEKTVSRAQERLTKLGWLNTASKGKFNTIRQSVSVAALPIAPTDKLSVSDTAKRLALAYHDYLKKVGLKKYPKGWIERQFYSAQRILNDIDDPQQAARVLTFAVRDPRFCKLSRKSLYHVVGLAKRWKAIKRAFQEHERAAAQPTRAVVEAETKAASAVGENNE
jgi:hypothetical protein